MLNQCCFFWCHFGFGKGPSVCSHIPACRRSWLSQPHPNMGVSWKGVPQALPPSSDSHSDSLSLRGGISSIVCLSMTEPSLLAAAQMEGLALLPLASPCPRIPRARIARQPGRWAHLGCRYRWSRVVEGDLMCCVLGRGVTSSLYSSPMRQEHLLVGPAS